MTKQEAIDYMIKGYKVKHRWFDTDEWMTIKDGKMLLEDGVTCSIQEFFSSRTDETWDDGYDVLDLDIKNLFSSMYENHLVNLINNPYHKLREEMAEMRNFGLSRKQREADIQPIRTTPKYGRNEKCHCGSGKKYKNCCINK